MEVTEVMFCSRCGRERGYFKAGAGCKLEDPDKAGVELDCPLRKASSAATVEAADRFELHEHHARHVLDVLRDANVDRCPECGPIQADLETWLKRFD